MCKLKWFKKKTKHEMQKASCKIAQWQLNVKLHAELILNVMIALAPLKMHANFEWLISEWLLCDRWLVESVLWQTLDWMIVSESQGNSTAWYGISAAKSPRHRRQKGHQLNCMFRCCSWIVGACIFFWSTDTKAGIMTLTTEKVRFISSRIMKL